MICELVAESIIFHKTFSFSEIAIFKLKTSRFRQKINQLPFVVFFEFTKFNTKFVTIKIYFSIQKNEPLIDIISIQKIIFSLVVGMSGEMKIDR